MKPTLHRQMAVNRSILRCEAKCGCTGDLPANDNSGEESHAAVWGARFFVLLVVPVLVYGALLVTP